MLAPLSPPPMMTQRARPGRSAGTGLPEPGLARIGGALLQPGEVAGGVLGVVEVERRDRALHHATSPPESRT